MKLATWFIKELTKVASPEEAKFTHVKNFLEELIEVNAQEIAEQRIQEEIVPYPVLIEEFKTQVEKLEPVYKNFFLDIIKKKI